MRFRLRAADGRDRLAADVHHVPGDRVHLRGGVRHGAVFGLAWSDDTTASDLRDAARTRNLTQSELGSYNGALAERNRFRVASPVSATAGLTFGAIGLGLYVVDTRELLPGR